MPITKADSENLLVMVGRLMEATKVTSETIKTLSEENKENTAAVTRALASLASLQQTVQDLDRIVRSGTAGEGLVTQVKIIVEEQMRLRDDVEELAKSHKEHQEQTEKLQSTAWQIHGGKTVIVIIIVVLFQLTTLGAAIYGALK